MLLALGVQLLNAQQKTVSGTVSDENGLPLPGATVYMNGFQAWNEWRRLDFPQQVVPAAAVINTIPVKLPYALSETQSNSAI